MAGADRYLGAASRPNLSIILPDLLVGEYPRVADIPWLRDAHGVTAVLSLQDDLDLATRALEISALENGYRECALEFHRMPIPDCDDRALAGSIHDIVERLHQLLLRGRRVYVHCNAGMNRAPTVAIAYLHRHRDMSLPQARDFVKQRRHCVPYMRVLEGRFAP